MKIPLVLMPEMMCDVRIFENQINVLSRNRAVTFAPITEGERIEDIASELLDQLPHRFALCGLGMGGVVAMEMLRRAPDRLAKLCLIGVSPLAETPADASEREPQIVRARTGRLDEVMNEIMRAEYLAPGPGRVPVLNQFRAMAADLGDDVFVRQSRALQRRRDQQGTLRKCKVPALILCGEYDTLTPLKRQEFMADLIPTAQLRVIANAGHLPTLEQPEAVTEILQEWLI